MDALTERDFSGTTLDRPGLVAVAFVADWCGYCRRFLTLWTPYERAAPVPLATADASDDDGPLWENFDLSVVPTIMLFKDGKVVWRKNGTFAIGLRERDLQALAEAAKAHASP